jgi:hypothetical protein
MKPHILRQDGLWCCRVLDYKGGPHFFWGKTPSEAFAVWEQTKKRLREMGMLWEIFP